MMVSIPSEGVFNSATFICISLSYSESDILSVTHVLGYNIVRFGSVLHTLLKMKNKGNFFYIIIFFLLQKKH